MRNITQIIKDNIEIKYTIFIVIFFFIGMLLGNFLSLLQSISPALRILLAVFCIILVAVAAWIFLRRIIIEPIRSLENATTFLSRGHLNFRLDAMTSDELGRLTKALNSALKSISSILQRVKDGSSNTSEIAQKVDEDIHKISENADIVSESIFNIASSLEQMNTASSEISKTTENLVVSTEEKAASLEQMVSSIGQVANNAQDLSNTVDSTSASIEELSATIKEVANKAEELTAVSEETMTAAEEIFSSIKEVEQNVKESATLSEKVKNDASTFGITSVEKTIEGIQNIKTSFDKTANFIKKLGGRSDEIGKILNVIDEITDQTTLLALNAAILAAQAGEHGKGFSVVADEIKDLAERTSFSTREIAELIKGVQQEVKDTTNAMDAGLESVEEGLRVAHDAGTALNKIVDSSKQSAEMSLSIERSTAEQAKATKLVSGSMERVKNMVSQVAKATLEQSKGALLITRATEKMRDVSNHVKSATGEQLVSIKQISESIEMVSDKSRLIAKAVNEQRAGSQQIFNSIETIRDIPKTNKEILLDINNSLKGLFENTALITKELEQIRLSRDKTSKGDKSE